MGRCQGCQVKGDTFFEARGVLSSVPQKLVFFSAWSFLCPLCHEKCSWPFEDSWQRCRNSDAGLLSFPRRTTSPLSSAPQPSIPKLLRHSALCSCWIQMLFFPPYPTVTSLRRQSVLALCTSSPADPARSPTYFLNWDGLLAS